MKTETEKELELRELDIFCAEKVMGWNLKSKPFEFFKTHDGLVFWEKGKCGSHWRPTTNPADALAVLEKCAEKCGVIKIVKLGYWWVNDNQKSCEGKADTLPLAIARFAKALYSK